MRKITPSLNQLITYNWAICNNILNNISIHIPPPHLTCPRVWQGHRLISKCQRYHYEYKLQQIFFSFDGKKAAYIKDKHRLYPDRGWYIEIIHHILKQLFKLYLFVLKLSHKYAQFMQKQQQIYAIFTHSIDFVC